MKTKWPIVKLKDLMRQNRTSELVKSDRSYRLLGIRLEGNGVFIREEKLGSHIGAKTLQKVDAGDFIYSRLFAWRGAFGVIPSSMNGAYVSNEFPNFKVDERRVYPRYLELYFRQRSIWKDVEKKCSGTTKASRNRFKERFFLDVDIPLPSLEEQKSIAQKIDEFITLVGEAKKLGVVVLEEAKALFEYAVDKAFEDTNHAKRQKLSAVTTKIGSGSTPMGGRKSYPTSGIHFIRSLNVRMREFQWEGIVFISRETHEKMHGTRVRPNDVLLNITGASIGRVAVVPSNLTEANVNQHVSIIRPTEILDSRYLMYWLSQPSIQNLIDESQKGETREGLTKAQIGSFEAPLPELSEQHRMVAYLDSLHKKVDAIEELAKDSGKEIEAIVPSILNETFK